MIRRSDAFSTSTLSTAGTRGAPKAKARRTIGASRRRTPLGGAQTRAMTSARVWASTCPSTNIVAVASTTLTRTRLVASATTDCARLTKENATNRSWLRRSARAVFVPAERPAHTTASRTGAGCSKPVTPIHIGELAATTTAVAAEITRLTDTRRCGSRGSAPVANWRCRAGSRPRPHSTNVTCITAFAAATTPKAETSSNRVRKGVTSAAATIWIPQRATYAVSRPNSRRMASSTTSPSSGSGSSEPSAVPPVCLTGASRADALRRV